MTIVPKPWMRHWQRAGKPVRYVVRDPGGVLRGFAQEQELTEFIEAYGGTTEEVLDLQANPPTEPASD
jgi:hypothetical protein